MKTLRAWTLNLVLILLGASLGMTAFAGDDRLSIEPHLVLPLETEITETQAKCLSLIEGAEIRFCAGETTDDGDARMEIFLRKDYRGEFGVRDDRGSMLESAYGRLVNACGVKIDLTLEEFRDIVGTPLKSLGTESLKDKAMSVLDITSLYYFDMGIRDYLQSGLKLPTRSRCQNKVFLGM
ncbi:MAG: hypothetical protein KF767_18050 [Bdellovibrionaceae bacterium]|nr:hypothetical protein [Pseudobdellovibrionaceae bacterium]